MSHGDDTNGSELVDFDDFASSRVLDLDNYDTRLGWIIQNINVRIKAPRSRVPCVKEETIDLLCSQIYIGYKKQR